MAKLIKSSNDDEVLVCCGETGAILAIIKNFIDIDDTEGNGQRSNRDEERLAAWWKDIHEKYGEKVIVCQSILAVKDSEYH